MSSFPEFFGVLSMMVSFGLGYLIARRYIWSEKTNHLLNIESVKTSEGVKKV